MPEHHFDKRQRGTSNTRPTRSSSSEQKQSKVYIACKCRVVSPLVRKGIHTYWRNLRALRRLYSNDHINYDKSDECKGSDKMCVLPSYPESSATVVDLTQQIKSMKQALDHDAEKVLSEENYQATKDRRRSSR